MSSRAPGPAAGAGPAPRWPSWSCSSWQAPLEATSLRDRWIAITAVSGVVLIAMGILLLTGELTRLNTEAQQALDSLGLNIFSEL